MTPLAKGISSLGILMAIIITGFVFAMRGCLSKYDERMALPPSLYFKNDSNAVFLSLVKYSKTTSYSRSGGFVQKTVDDYYYLQNNEAVSGNKIAGKKLASRIKYFPAKILGADGRNAWIFLNELMAFDAFTLQQVADVKIIEAKNPSLSGLMPAEAQYYRFDETVKAIVFTSSEGAQWQLNASTLIAKPYRKPLKEDATNFEERLALQLQDRLKQLSQLSLHFTQLKVNQDTCIGKWLGLYSAEEIETLNTAITFSPASQQEQRRQFYTAGYDAGSSGSNKLNKPFSPANKAGAFYLDGGFLADKESARAIRMSDPLGFLLVYKTKIGEKGEIMLARIGADGTPGWKINTGLKNWIDYQYKDNRLFIFGNDHKNLNSSYCTLFLSVDLRTGLVNKYDYFEDALRK